MRKSTEIAVPIVLAICSGVIVLAVIVVGLVAFLLGTVIDGIMPKQYSTTDPALYGEYQGNYDNRSVQEFVSAFFPAEIEPYYEDVQYSYRAQKGDAYAFETYLEFTIDDTQRYNEFVSRYTSGLEAVPFRYNSDFTEYTVSDIFRPVYDTAPSYEEEDGVAISYAKIGKILCCPEENRIIFVALGVYDGGMADTAFLNIFFNRFSIPPREYAAQLNAASSN